MAYRVLATTKGIANKKDVLREYEPAKRIVFVNDEEMHYVEFPITLFYFRRSNLFVAFAKNKMKSLKSVVYQPTVGNVKGGKFVVLAVLT